MERSLGSEGSPGTSLAPDGGDDLVGVSQPNPEKHQQLFVRYSGLSEGKAPDPVPDVSKALLDLQRLQTNSLVSP